MAVIKRFLNGVVRGAGVGLGWQAGKRAGNDAYEWVKSGEAGDAIERLGQKTIAVARVAKDKLVGASEDAGGALKKGVREVRARLDPEEHEERREGGAEAREAAAEEELSEDDRAAAQARRQAAVSAIEVHCTHCDAPVKVPADAELARCTACNQRFWIDAADRD